MEKSDGEKFLGMNDIIINSTPQQVWYLIGIIIIWQ